MMRQKKTVYLTMALSGASMMLGYLITFFLTPYITNTMGSEAYGFVTLSKQIASYADIITLALNSYATRFIAVAYHEGDRDKSNKYFNSVLYANVFLNFAILCVFSICIWKLEFILIIAPELMGQVKCLFFMTAVGFAIVTSASVLNASAYITDRLAMSNFFKGVSYIVEALVLFALFSIFKSRLWFVACGTIAASMINVSANAYIVRRYTPDIRVNKKYVSLRAIKELVLNGVWNSLNSLGNMLNSGLDLLVTNIMLGGLAMGQIAIAKTIGTVFSALMQIVAQPFQPMFLKSYVNGSATLVSDLKYSMKISGLASNILFAGFVALGEFYYELWIPTQDTLLVWKLTVITLMGYVAEGAVFPLYYIYTLTIKNRIPCLVTIIGGIMNVIGMYVLVRKTSLGVYSIVVTTLVVMTAINLVSNPIYMAKCLSVKIRTFYPQILLHCISCAVLTIVFVKISACISIEGGWIALITKAIICAAIGIPIHLLIVNLFSMKSTIRRIISK